MGLIGSVISFMILICVLVIVHELGHLIIARANGVFCEAFSVGFGPVLWEKTDKKGTKWRFSLLPIGGYVKMFGDADATSVKETIPNGYTEEDMERMSAHRKKPWQRLLIAAGGPFANFIFAIFVLFSLSMIKGLPEPDNTITVSGQESLAYISGLRDGDKIIKADGQDIHNFEEFRDKITTHSGKELSLSVKRDDKLEEINVKMFKEEDGKIVPIKTLGVSPKGFVYKKVGILKAVSSSIVTTYTIASENIKSIFKIITAKMSSKNVGGIISIFKMSADSAEAGIAIFAGMLAMLSIVLGAINLLPIPVLDGGTIVLSAIEWIIGRPLNKKFVESIFMIGLIVVASLMLLGIWNDLSKCKFFVMLENLFK